MKIRYFAHSLSSCWNNGNAHFQRGVLDALHRAGHEVLGLEPEDGWSAANLVADHGPGAREQWRAAYPDLPVQRYGGAPDAAALTDGADLVIVHEWTDPALVAAVGRLRVRGAPFTLLFHDTHHRAVTDPAAIRAFDLSGFDGVLAFGETLSEVYRRWGWGARAFTWHEAADTRRFRPPPDEDAPVRDGLVWIGNWGDGERSAELVDYLLEPACAAGLPPQVHGVRYPAEAQAMLRRFGATWHGWLANSDAPAVFGRRLMTVHVPRRAYADRLAGIPTIRMFEALAAGIPLVSAPWDDCEGLFRGGRDYLSAGSPAAMARALQQLAADADMRAEIAAHGRATVSVRHSCDHRAAELIAIVERLRGDVPAPLETA